MVIWMLDMCNNYFGFALENKSWSIKDQKFIMDDTLIFNSQSKQSFFAWWFWYDDVIL